MAACEYQNSHGVAETAGRWVIYDPLITDYVIRSILEPIESDTVRPGFVTFTGTILQEHDICTRVRQYERTILADFKAQQAAKDAIESRKRFEAYYASLDLDDVIPIPETVSWNKRQNLD